MWWNDYWSMPWAVLGPATTIVLALICFAFMLFMMRMMHRHRGDASPAWGGMMACCGGSAEADPHADTRSTSSNPAAWPRTASSSAFDEYREATLRRLEHEQGEFAGFLDQLRHAKDKAEFDQFMGERGKTQTQA